MKQIISEIFKKENQTSYLFALGNIMIIMTNLRFGELPVGLGELIVLFVIVFVTAKDIMKGDFYIRKNGRVVLLFWVSYISLFSIGTITFSDYQMDGYNALRNLFAYLYTFGVTFFLCYRSQQNNLNQIIKITVVVGGGLFFFLALWRICISDNFFGVPLVYMNNRFTGGSNNPNQLALFLVPLPTMLLYYAQIEQGNIYKKTMCLILSLSSVFVGILSESDALLVTWAMVLLMIGGAIALKNISTYAKKALIISASICIGVIILFSLYKVGVTTEVKKVISEIDQSASRQQLWALGIQQALKSPFIGFGAGLPVELSAVKMKVRISGALGIPGYLIEFPALKMEAHNLYIDILLQTGGIGLGLFLTVLIYIFKRMRKDFLLKLSLTALLCFSGAHFTLRQPILWMYLIYFLFSGESVDETQKNCN